MFDRLKSLFAADEAGAGRRPVDQLQLAAACLLVEAAHQDAEFDVRERETVARLVRDRFGLDSGEAETLLAAADNAVADAVDFYGYTRRLKDAFDHDERVGMIEMLWQVVYADGTLHDHEASLLRRVAALLYVSDRESGEARKRVLQKGGTVG
ncbi:MAG: TerB family tellurite resistance protein [Alphaproteobacteria bacterium]|jgi:uncharacterized tellurite resistance protein B-like protein